MSHHDGQRAARTSTLHANTHFDLCPPFKMFIKIKRVEGEQEVPSRRRRRVTPRQITRLTNQRAARPTHTSTYAPPTRGLRKLNEPKASRRFPRAGGAVSHHEGQRAARTSTLHDQHTLRPMPPLQDVYEN